MKKFFVTAEEILAVRKFKPTEEEKKLISTIKEYAS